MAAAAGPQGAGGTAGAASSGTLGCLIEPDKVADLGSAVIGVLDSLRAERGDVVRKGQVLAFVSCKGGSGATFIATNLGYALAAGGRIPPAAAQLTAKLDVKPELSYDLAGSLSLIGVNRGRKKALKSILKSFRENYVPDRTMPIAIMTADAEKDGDWLEAAIRKEEGCADVTIIRGSVGPTIGSHVGPGMVACAFWGKNRAEKASLSDRIARRVRGE